MSILSKFIWQERFQYADVNQLAASLGQAEHYYNFLVIILDRYNQVSAKYISATEAMIKPKQPTSDPTPVTPEEFQLMEESGRLGTLVHLEIESFYLFAKIFLDTIARFLRMYFGQERKVKLNSHDNLVLVHMEYFKAKNLVVPEGLTESINYLKERICDYRDKEISHELSLRRLKATTWGTSKAPKIASGIVFPREGDKTAMSEELPKLMIAVDKYTEQITNLIEFNRAKSRFELKRD